MNNPRFSIRVRHSDICKRDTYIYFKKDSDLDNNSKRKIEFIINFIYLCFPKIDRDFEVDFGKFLFTINKSNSIKRNSDLEAMTECQSNTLMYSEKIKDEKSLNEELMNNIKKNICFFKDLVSYNEDFFFEIFEQKDLDLISNALISLFTKNSLKDLVKMVGKYFSGIDKICSKFKDS